VPIDAAEGAEAGAAAASDGDGDGGEGGGGEGGAAGAFEDTVQLWTFTSTTPSVGTYIPWLRTVMRESGDAEAESAAVPEVPVSWTLRDINFVVHEYEAPDGPADAAEVVQQTLAQTALTAVLSISLAVLAYKIMTRDRGGGRARPPPLGGGAPYGEPYGGSAGGAAGASGGLAGGPAADQPGPTHTPSMAAHPQAQAQAYSPPPPFRQPPPAQQQHAYAGGGTRAGAGPARRGGGAVNQWGDELSAAAGTGGGQDGSG